MRVNLTAMQAQIARDLVYRWLHQHEPENADGIELVNRLDAILLKNVTAEAKRIKRRCRS